MKKYILASIVFVLIPFINIFSQNTEQIIKMPSITPLSPNASALRQFGSFPIGNYTGTPDISIPVYEIDLDGSKFPIILSYNASGIRVCQEASWVGLGWTLKTGGTITKEIRGGNDFYGNNLTNSTGADSDYGYHFNTWPAWPPRDAGDNIDMSYAKENPALLEILSGQDTQPDLFHFSFGTYSGTMFFDKDPDNNIKIRKPIVQTPSDFLDITFNFEKKTWIIIDQYGYKYTFKTTEITEVFETDSEAYNSFFTEIKERIPPRNKMAKIETSWYLDEIESPNGKKITLSYASELITTPITTSESTHMAVGYEVGTNMIISRDLKLSFNYSFSVIIQKTLKKIEFDDGSIIFSTSDRKDIDPVAPSRSLLKNTTGLSNKPQKLDAIEFINKQNTSIKKIVFNYYYMGNEAQYNNCRLMLHSLSDISENNTNQKYKFSYIEGDLPDKNSWGTDIWGFYNGPLRYIGSGFKTLPPMTIAYTLFKPAYLPSQAILYGGKYAIPDSLKMQIGTLDMIEYPTGGKSKFVYEPHWFEGGFHIFEGVFNSGYSYINHEPAYSVHQNQRTFYGEDFTIDKMCYAYISAFHVSRYEYGVIPPERTIFLYLEQKLPNNQYVKIGELIHLCKGQPETTKSANYYLSPGTYRLKIMKELKPGVGGDQPLPNNYLFTGAVNVENSKIPKLNFGGGLRIKEILNIEGNKVLSKKKYLYNKGKESSGILIKKPGAANMALMDRNVADFSLWSTIDNLAGNVMRHGYVTPYVSLSGGIEGVNVGYSHVEEMNEDMEGQSNGKTVYRYFVDAIKPKVLIPGFPEITNPVNGSLLGMIQYDKNNSLVYKNDKNYILADGQTNKATAGLILYYTDGRCGAKFYDLKSKRWMVKDETTIQYFNKGKDSIVTKTDYQYHPQIWQLNNIQTTDSKNQKQETRIKFTYDYDDAVNFKMKNKNMVGIPIETINLKENSVISANKTIYYDTLDLTLPRYTQILETTTPLSINTYSQKYKLNLSFEKYNNKGYLLQARDHSGITVSYLWSYNGQYPIAEIRNATFVEVEATVKTVFSVTSADALSAQLTPNEAKLKDGSLQRALPNAFVTTCTYKPLVGVLTATNAAGITTYYDYDTFGRLKETYIIENGVKKLIQVNDYHYQNQ